MAPLSPGSAPPPDKAGRSAPVADRAAAPGAGFGTDPSGLTEAEVLARRRAGQGNRAVPSAGRSYLRILVEGAFAPVNVVLFATCLVLVWLGLGVDAAVTSIPVLQIGRAHV